MKEFASLCCVSERLLFNVSQEFLVRVPSDGDAGARAELVRGKKISDPDITGK